MDGSKLLETFSVTDGGPLWAQIAFALAWVVMYALWARVYFRRVDPAIRRALDDDAQQVVVRIAVLEFLAGSENQRLVEHAGKHLSPGLRDALQPLELWRFGNVEDPRGMRQEVMQGDDPPAGWTLLKVLADRITQ